MQALHRNEVTMEFEGVKNEVKPEKKNNKLKIPKVEKDENDSQSASSDTLSDKSEKSDNSRDSRQSFSSMKQLFKQQQYQKAKEQQFYDPNTKIDEIIVSHYEGKDMFH